MENHDHTEGTVPAFYGLSARREADPDTMKAFQDEALEISRKAAEAADGRPCTFSVVNDAKGTLCFTFVTGSLREGIDSNFSSLQLIASASADYGEAGVLMYIRNSAYELVQSLQAVLDSMANAASETQKEGESAGEGASEDESPDSE